MLEAQKIKKGSQKSKGTNYVPKAPTNCKKHIKEEKGNLKAS
jgi:hypothetical protein